MAITKIQSGAIPADAIDTTHIGDVGADKITGQVVSSQISDLNVTHAKLHTTMDLSSKTVTLPTLSTLNITGNVGIGTASPNSNLHVKSTGDVKLTLETDEDNDCWINLSGATSEASIGYEPSTNSLRFANAADGVTSNVRMTIDDSGNVGIGTETPAQLLEVSGNGKKSRFTRSGSAGTLVEYYYGSNPAGGIQVQSTGLGIGGAARENDLFIKTDGNVGIGTGSPTGKLDISAGTASGTMYDALVLRGGANSTQGSGVRLHMTGTGNDPLSRGVILQSEMTNNGNNHDFSVWTSQASAHTKKFTIDNQGQVAIGTSAPSGTRLHIHVPNSGSGLTDSVKIQDSSGYVGIAMYVGAADGEIRLGSAGQLRGKISGAGVGSRTDHNFDLYQNGTTAAGLRSSINGTGRRGLHMLSNSLGFDQSGVRSWEMRAEGGNLRMDSGDGYGKVQVNAGFKAKSIQLGNDSTHSTFGAQSGYMGDWWEAGHKAVYYLGYLGSSASNPGTANWFNFYTSGHWGQYTRVMVYSFNHYPGPGYSKWDINGTTVTQVEGRGSVGSVTSTQSTVSSNGHSGQPVYKYTVNFTMPGTYTQGPWFVAHVSGGGAGHLSNAHTDAQADSWFSIRGGGMHLRNVSTDAMKTSPMYVTGT